MNIKSKDQISDKILKLAKYKRKMNTQTVSRLLWYIIRLILILGLSFMILYPLLIKFISSIKSAADISDPSIIFLPKSPTLYSYELVFNASAYPTTFLFSVFFTLLNSFLQIASCIMVAYGLARFKFKGKNIIFSMIIFTLIVPPQTMLLPLYLRFRYFSFFSLFKFTGALSGVDMIDTIVPFLLLSATAIAFKNGLYIFLLRQHFRNMPIVLEEAAYIDGCGPFKTFLRIMVPGAVPMIITVFLFSFVWQWNDTYYSQTLAPNIPLLANRFFGMVFNVMDAGSAELNQFLGNAKFFLLIIPLVILFIFTQRFFTESIEKSGTVG